MRICLARDNTCPGHAHSVGPTITHLPGCDPEHPKKLTFQGCVIPAMHTERFRTEDDMLDNFTDEERKNLQLVGLDVSIEHEYDYFGDKQDRDKHVVVGKITRQWFTEANELMVEGEVDPKTYKGNLAKDGLLNGELKGLSLAHQIRVCLNSPMRQYIKRPIEVSICKKGKRPHTNIDRIVCASALESTFEDQLIELVGIILMSSTADKSTTPATNTQAPATNTQAPANTQTPAKPESTDAEMKDVPAGGEDSASSLARALLFNKGAEALKAQKKLMEEKEQLAKELEELKKGGSELEELKKQIAKEAEEKKKRKREKFIAKNKEKLEEMVPNILKVLLGDQDPAKVSQKKADELKAQALEKAVGILENPETAWMATRISVHTDDAVKRKQLEQQLEEEKAKNEFMRLYREANGLPASTTPNLQTPLSSASSSSTDDMHKRTRNDDEPAEAGWHTSLFKASAGASGASAPATIMPGGMVPKRTGIQDIASVAAKTFNNSMPLLEHQVVRMMQAREEVGEGDSIRAFSADERGKMAVGWSDFNLFENEAWMKEMGLDTSYHAVRNTKVVKMAKPAKEFCDAKGKVWPAHTFDVFNNDKTVADTPSIFDRPNAFNWNVEMATLLCNELRAIHDMGSFQEKLSQAESNLNAMNQLNLNRAMRV